jgi:hypothetical protein
MIPLLLVSTSIDAQKRYISEYLDTHSAIQQNITEIEKLSMEQIRELHKELIWTKDSLKVFVLYSFESASAEVQNSLLKTLEEKTEHNQFIVCVTNENAVLPTILSRVKKIYLEKTEETEKIDDDILFLKNFSKNPSLEYLGAKTVLVTTQERASQFFDSCIHFYSKRLEDDKNATFILKKILETKQFLLSNNLNPQLAVDSILLFIRKQHSL